MSKGKGTAPSRGEKFAALEAKVKNLEASIRIMQMMQQQMGQSLMPMQQDVSGMATQLQTTSYTNLALQELLGVDSDKLDEVYQRLRLTDYNEVSDKEDEANGYTPLEEVVSDQNIVILTSNTPDEPKDKGIFRTKMVVGELGPDLAELIIGKKVGDTFEHDLQGVKHVIELLAIKEVPAPVVEEVPESLGDISEEVTSAVAE
jgi:hypothetical protein